VPAFVQPFKEVQKLQTQLDQYTDLTAEQVATIQSNPANDELNAFRGALPRNGTGGSGPAE